MDVRYTHVVIRNALRITAHRFELAYGHTHDACHGDYGSSESKAGNAVWGEMVDADRLDLFILFGIRSRCLGRLPDAAGKAKRKRRNAVRTVQAGPSD